MEGSYNSKEMVQCEIDLMVQDGIDLIEEADDDRQRLFDLMEFFEILANLKQHPEELAPRLFGEKEHGETIYESAVRKFGAVDVFRVLNVCIPYHEAYDHQGGANFGEAFIAAASCENSAVPVIFYLLRKNIDAFPPVVSHGDGGKYHSEVLHGGPSGENASAPGDPNGEIGVRSLRVPSGIFIFVWLKLDKIKT